MDYGHEVRICFGELREHLDDNPKKKKKPFRQRLIQQEIPFKPQRISLRQFQIAYRLSTNENTFKN
jgi:hypothetical protein